MPIKSNDISAGNQASPPCVQAAHPDIEAVLDYDRAATWLAEYFAPTQLFAIHPETGKVDGLWFDGTLLGTAAQWMRAANGRGFNLYFTANQPRRPRNIKPGKDEIEAIRCLYADIDAKGDRDMATAWAAIGAGPLPPTLVIATGGGFQPIWLLDAPIPKTLENERRAEALGKRIAELTGGDHVQNVDRILRVPFTTNRPDERKRARGRVPTPSGLVRGGSERRYTLDEIDGAVPASPTAASGAMVIVFPGTAPAVSMTRPSGMTAAAQANLPTAHWFDRLSADQKNELLHAIAARVAALADTDRTEWLRLLFAFVDAEQRGATEARAAALAWCKTSARFKDETDFDRDWRSFKAKPDGVTVGTLLDAAEEKAGFDLSSWRDGARGDVTTVVAAGLPIAPGGALPITAIPHLLSPDQAVEVMNRTFIVAHRWGNDGCVVQLHPDGRSVEGISWQHLYDALSNRFVIDQSEKKPERIPLAKYWRVNTKRAEVDRVIYDPEGKYSGGENTLNLWKGLAVQPVKGCWRLMSEHLFTIICRRDRACWKYLIRWLSHAVQHPGTRPGSVIVLRSDAQGTGKTVVVDWMAEIFGEHGLSLNSPEQFIGEHNDHLENKSFIGLNEPTFPGDHRAAGKFKSMITDSNWTINPKHRKLYTIQNIAHLMLTTNAEWAIPAGSKDRRFLMLDVDASRVGDGSIKKVRREAADGGVAAMLHALLQVDLSNFDSWIVPKTAALREQQLRGANSMVQWAADAAASRVLIPADPQLPFAAAPLNGGFDQEVSGSALYKAYANWCRTMHARAFPYVAFGRWLSKCGISGRPSNSDTIRAIPGVAAFSVAVLSGVL
jgi:hypothetical protein